MLLFDRGTVQVHEAGGVLMTVVQIVEGGSKGNSEWSFVGASVETVPGTSGI